MSEDQAWVAAAIVGAVLPIAYILYHFSGIFDPKKVIAEPTEIKGRNRSMSFNSSVFLSGVFPTSAAVKPAVINSLFMFKSCPSEAILVDACKNLVHFDRFRNAVKFDGKEWVFVETVVDFSKHIDTVTVISEKNMMDECDRIVLNDLGEYDGVKPLWTFHRLVNKGSGLSGLLIRIHHVIGDGISLVTAMSKILTDESGAPLQLKIPDAKDSGKERERMPAPSLFQKVGSLMDILSLPVSKYDTKTLFSPSNTDKMVMTSRRRSIVFPTVRLDFIKKIKNKAQVTVNDVLLSVMTGAIRKYCVKRGDPSMKSEAASKLLHSRCLMPVSLPRPLEQFTDPATALRNYWVMVSVAMPLAPSTAKGRLLECHATTALVKKSPTAFIQMYLQNLLPKVLPRFLQQKTAFDIFSRHTLVFSNVPGPSEMISLCGEQVVGMQILFPNILPTVILISYAGGVFFNMNLDDDEMPGAVDELPKYYLEEFKELAAEYGVDTEDMLNDLSPEGFIGISKSS